MYRIEIEITEEKARRWRTFLADALERETGSKVRTMATLDEICLIVLSSAVAKESARQAEEVEKSL